VLDTYYSSSRAPVGIAAQNNLLAIHHLLNWGRRISISKFSSQFSMEMKIILPSKFDKVDIDLHVII